LDTRRSFYFNSKNGIKGNSEIIEAKSLTKKEEMPARMKTSSPNSIYLFSVLIREELLSDCSFNLLF